MLLGLDLAQKCGVAYVGASGTIYTSTYTGTPIQQLEIVLDVIGGDIKRSVVVIEELNYFRNAKTVRSLAGRIGYIEHSLRRAGASVNFISATAARKYCGVKEKIEVAHLFGVPQDEADAVAVLVAFNKIALPVKIERMQNKNV